MTRPDPAYRPEDFWQNRLSEHFDLRGTGHPGCSFDYNRRCYLLRALVLDATLARHAVGLAGRRVLDAGCGTGFFAEHYLTRGALVSGVDLTEVSVRELSKRFPEARFEVGDLAEWRPRETYHLVSCFDVLFHIVEDAAWSRALDHLVEAVAPDGYFVFTEQFLLGRTGRLAAHNQVRSRAAYAKALAARGMTVLAERPTHHLMNSELGAFRFLNRAPALLYAVDRALLSARLLESHGGNRLVLARRKATGP